MKIRLALLILAAITFAHGQTREGARESDDIRDFLIQSEIVEFRPTVSRDPFLVPSDATTRDRGLLIDEVTIKGTIHLGKGKRPYAIILDPNQNTLRIPVGYSFLDGEITEITDVAVVFNQWDPNSTNRSGSRSVTKFFKHEEK